MRALIFSLLLGMIGIGRGEYTGEYTSPRPINYTYSNFYDPLFPPDIFNRRQLRQGAILLYVIGMDFMLIAAAFANDHFIVAAWEVALSKIPSAKIRGIIESPLISMARSFPKFIISMLGMCVAFSDIWVGTVVGSMAFHSTITVGCFLFLGSAITINWLNFSRSFLFYLLSLVVLIVITLDYMIGWWEALLLPAIYIVIFIPIVIVTDILFQRRSTSGGNNPIPLENIEASDIGDKVSPKNPVQSQNIFPSPPGRSCGCWCVLSWIVYVRILVPSMVVWVTSLGPCCDPKRMKDSKFWPISVILSLILGSLWVCGGCYLGVWWATVSGETKGMPPEFIGFLVIAFYISVPTTIHVIRANNISNLFGELLTDACFAISIPALWGSTFWFSRPVELSSNGFECLLVLLIPIFIIGLITLGFFSKVHNRGVKICVGVFYILAYVLIVIPLFVAFTYAWISSPF